MSQLEQYCRVEGEMKFRVRGPEAVGEDTSDRDVASAIFRRATILMESLGDGVFLKESTYEPREGLLLHFERTDR